MLIYGKLPLYIKHTLGVKEPGLFSVIYQSTNVTYCLISEIIVPAVVLDSKYDLCNIIN